AYILICVTLVAMGIYFFWFDGGVWQADRASVSRLMTFIPLVLSLLTIPLFTMRSLSEEKRMGTIELLITMPVKDSEVILGKYFAALAIVSVQLLLLVAYPIVMFKAFHLGAFDWGPFWSGIFGLILLSSAGIAVGLMYSSMTDSQILAFFATSVTLSALYAIGYVVQYIQGGFGDFLAFFSFQSRYEPFARGLIDSRAVVYFLSVAVLATLVSFRNLESRKWS
ncbi:ABC transporter permease, partial [bacterium]